MEGKGAIPGPAGKPLLTARADNAPMNALSHLLAALAGAAGAVVGMMLFASPNVPPHTPEVLVAGVAGAKGDGNLALASSLRTLIAARGIRALARPTNCALSVEGFVDHLPEGEGEQVRIVWRISDPAGSVVANVRQENTVAKGALDEGWGEAARLAAAGARDSLLAVLAETGGPCT